MKKKLARKDFGGDSGTSGGNQGPGTPADSTTGRRYIIPKKERGVAEKSWRKLKKKLKAYKEMIKGENSRRMLLR